MTLARISPELPFATAAALWLDSRSFRVPGAISARYIKPNTEKSYGNYIRTLNLFFGALRLEKIHIGHLRQYQEARVTGAEPFIRYRNPQDAKPKKLRDGTVLPAKGKVPCPAKPKKANQELATLRLIMRRGNCWTQEMDEFYERFEEQEPDVPRALSPEEQQRWLDVAGFKPRWHLVYWYSVLAFNTAMSTDEIRALRIGDVNLYHSIVSVPPTAGKNRHRIRTIPLYSADVKWAAEQLLARARDLGAADPQHHVFPFRRPPRPFDASKPMTVSGIKTLWCEVRDAANLKHFRPYDTRHTAITRWAEAGMHIAEIMALAGHMTRRQSEHYTHISNAVKMRALAKMHQPTELRSSIPFYVGARA
jgi:integrase